MSQTGAETQHQEDADSSSGHYVEMSEQQSSRRTPKKHLRKNRLLIMAVMNPARNLSHRPSSGFLCVIIG